MLNFVDCLVLTVESLENVVVGMDGEICEGVVLVSSLLPFPSFESPIVENYAYLRVHIRKKLAQILEPTSASCLLQMPHDAVLDPVRI